MAQRGRDAPEFRGDLQAEVMSAVWRLGEAKVEDIRALQPARRRSAYTTIQTVLNRLTDQEARGNTPPPLPKELPPPLPVGALTETGNGPHPGPSSKEEVMSVIRRLFNET